MKIAIFKRRNDFSVRWIEYCEKNNISYKIVNAYDSDIIRQVEDCTAFMWHHYHNDYRDLLFAKQLLYSLQKKRLKVFPNFNTTWHFDDKVGQKYLLEAIGAPLVPSYVFYTKKEALDWINNTEFPKVFKLRGGAGSANVKLAKTKSQAKKFVNMAFGRGFSQFDKLCYLKERYSKWRQGKDTFIRVCKGFARLFIPTEFAKMYHREKGYVYFQEFIPNNSFDIRVVVVGDKAFAIKRMCRVNDFRASGSGFLVYKKEEIDERCVSLALEVNKKLNSQCTAYDFIFDINNNPLIVEISYGFTSASYDDCEGYWDKDMYWHEGRFNPYGWMVNQVK